MTIVHAVIAIIASVVLTSCFWFACPGIVQRLRLYMQKELLRRFVILYRDIEVLLSKDEATLRQGLNRILGELKKYFPLALGIIGYSLLLNAGALLIAEHKVQRGNTQHVSSPVVSPMEWRTQLMRSMPSSR